MWDAYGPFKYRSTPVLLLFSLPFLIKVSSTMDTPVTTGDLQAITAVLEELRAAIEPLTKRVLSLEQQPLASGVPVARDLQQPTVDDGIPWVLDTSIHISIHNMVKVMLLQWVRRYGLRILP